MTTTQEPVAVDGLAECPQRRHGRFDGAHRLNARDSAITRTASATNAAEPRVIVDHSAIVLTLRRSARTRRLGAVLRAW